jgi:hypothetical protein
MLSPHSLVLKNLAGKHFDIIKQRGGIKKKISKFVSLLLAGLELGTKSYPESSIL